MRIVHVYKDFDPPIHGGMERHIALMCRYQRQWADVEALVCSRSWRTRTMDRDGTHVTEVGEWGRFQSAPAAPLFPWYMRRAKADVLVVHVPNPTAEIGYLLARPRGRLVVRYHSDVVRQAAAMKVYGPIQVKFLCKADMIIPTSRPYVDTSATLRAVAHTLSDEARARVIRVVPLGILTEEFAPVDPARIAGLRERYGGGYVLFAGRHRYYKGLEYLVRAAGSIKAPVVLVGDGPERASLEALARSVGGTVHFPGTLTQDDLVAHLHGCDVFAFPSVERSEAFGMSILEAHACGKPVVATRLGTGVEFANLDGETGWNVAPRDSEALAGAINRLLANEPMRAAMGERARMRVARDFHAERAARDEFALYQEVMACPKTGT